MLNFTDVNSCPASTSKNVSFTPKPAPIQPQLFYLDYNLEPKPCFLYRTALLHKERIVTQTYAKSNRGSKSDKRLPRLLFFYLKLNFQDYNPSH